MRRSPFLFLLLFCAAGAAAQSDQYVVSRQGTVTLLPAYETWSVTDGGVKFSEFSTVLYAYVPAGRNMGVSLRGGGAASGGDPAKLTGLTDVQVAASYHVESINTLFSLGVNLPVGKREMDTSEFNTSVLLSQSLFDLQVPVFGQGFNVNPGAAWVFPASDNVVIGLAGAFTYRGPYKPLKGGGEYDPGDEFTASTGVDFRLSEAASLSTDFVATFYSADTYDGKTNYASGNAYWVNVQYKQNFRENELLVRTGLRTKSKGQIQGAGGLVDETERMEPGRFDVSAQFRQVFNNRFALGYMLEGRFFEKTPSAYSGTNVYGAGLTPTITLPSKLSFQLRLVFQYGTERGGGTNFTGFHAGLGIGYTF
jgi:hypothetical protein